MVSTKRVLIRQTKRKPTAKNIASKALRLAKKNASMQEIKQNNFSLTDTVTVAGQWAHVSGLAQGDDFNERVGRQVTSKSLELKYHMIGNTSAVLTQRIRVVVLYDSQAQGVVPATLDVFEVDELESLPSANPAQKERFKILYDRTHILGNLVWNGTNTMQRTEKFAHTFIKLGRKVYYESTSAAVTGAGKNSLFFCYFSDDDANSPSVVFRARFSALDN